MNLDEFLKHEVSRRQFLGKSAQNAAGMAAGMVGLSGAVTHAGPNERVSLGIVGIRQQGKKLAAKFAALPDVDVVSVCDVDSNLLAEASLAIGEVQGRTPRRERDFRRLLDNPSIDAVVLATPAHWHATMTLMACAAGKDVYVETPVSHNIDEGDRMIAAARKHGRIVQAGLQQRSGTHFRSAVELVHSGALGAVPLAKAWTVHRRKPIGFKADGSIPTGVDYELWLGPAPSRPFNANRFHHNWQWFWDYGAGELGHWGVHMLDVARWRLGVDLPTRISAAGGKFHFHDDQQTPDTLNVQYAFPDHTILWEHRLWSTHGPEGRSAAVAFYGEQGTLVVDRGGWKIYDRKEPIIADTSEQLGNHCRHFIDCLKTRELPVADIEVGHLSSTLCHLGNIAYRLGREIQFDSEHLDVRHDDEARLLLSREYRPQWELPAV